MAAGGDSPPGQPLIAIVLGIVAGSSLFVAWRAASIPPAIGLKAAVYLSGCAAAVVLAYHFPIHVSRSTKVYIAGLPIYLLTTLVSPPQASAAVGLAIAAGEVSSSRRTGNLDIPSLIPTQVARWILISLAAATVAHLAPGDSVLGDVGAGAALWLGDMLTGPLLLSPVLGESPQRVLSMMIRTGGGFEAVQYAIGLCGALVTQYLPWGLILMVPPAILVHYAFKQRTEAVSHVYSILEAVTDTAEARAGHAIGHSARVADLVRGMLSVLRVYGPRAERITAMARFHDIGMMAAPDDLLRQREPLTAAEWAIIQEHAAHGAELVERYPAFAAGATDIRHHHERWDGAGYPDGLSGASIPLGARLIAVADAYDAMTHHRPYQPAQAAQEVADVLYQGAGQQWDPKAVAALFTLLELRPSELHVVRSGPTRFDPY